MRSWIPKYIVVSLFAMSLTACGGYQEGGNRSNISVQETGDNRQEYLIKNRTDENDYLDMNTDPNMDTRAMDERRMGTTTDARQTGEITMEQTVRNRVLQMDGVRSAEVRVKDKQISVRFQAKDGTNSQELKKHIADTVTKLYRLPVQVNEAVK